MIKKIYSLLPPGDLWKLLGMLLMMLAVSVLELLGVSLVPLFVAILADPERLLEISELAFLWEFFNVTDFQSLFYFGMISILCIFIIKNLFVILYHYAEGRFLWNRYKYISANLFEKYLQAPYTFHLHKNSSVILRNVANEARYLVNDALAPFIKLCMNALLILGIVMLLVYFEPVITLIAFGLIGGLGGAASLLLKNKIKSLGSRSMQARTGIIQSVNEGIGGLKEIRVAKKEKWFMNQYLRDLRKYVHSQTLYTAAMYSNKPVMETISVVCIMGIAFILYVQGVSTEYLITILALFGSATIRLLPAMREIARDLNSIYYYKDSVDAVYEEFEILKKYSDENTKKNKPPVKKETGAPYRIQKEIVFDDVCFTYPQAEKKAGSHLSFKIKKGEMIGFAGETGSGKTTVVDLLLGLLEPDSGKITVDDMPLYMYLHHKNGAVGYVPQFIFFSDDTLLKNIALGSDENEIDMQWVQTCIEAAQLKDVVEQMPDGLNTKIGEHGVRLSGGQRQRIGIARVLYQKPDILIFDEATSALDRKTEKKIMKSIEEMRAGRTTLMIAHRLSTLESCDVIYFFQDGRIVDTGTLDDLIKKNPAFSLLSSV